MKSVFTSRRNKDPHTNEGKERKEAPFFARESKTPFFNVANGGAVQAKLTVGQPGDKYEKEADHMADAVVNNTSKPAIQNKEISSIQRESLATPQEDEKLGTAEQRVEEDKLVQEKPEIQKMEAPEEEMVSKMEGEEEEIQKMEAPEEEMVSKMEGEEEEIQKMEASEEEKLNKKEEEETVQTKNESATQTASTGLSSKIKSKAGTGKKMPPQIKAEMESGFGRDFSDVTVHTDQDAIGMNKQLGAQAFTHGMDIYFNSGKYNPDTTQGKRLLAHELTHVVQQSKDNEKPNIQRHMQNVYPWDGIISARWSATLRTGPSMGGFLANIPSGTRITVIGSTNNWLNVRVFHNNIQKTGYIYHNLVSLVTSDIVVDEMNSLVGQESAWYPSGGTSGVGDTSGNDFADWASASSESTAPVVARSTTINCWEMVLLSAYRTGAITWNFIHDLYINQPMSNWPSVLTTSRSGYTFGDPIPRGKIVFFNGINHVALSTGNNDDVLTFWPPPDFTRYTRGTVDEVKIRTASSLINAMGGIRRVVVEIGDPVW